MKILVLYPHPMEPDGVSIQGHDLCRGLAHAGVEVIPCHFRESLQKEYYLSHFKPDVVIGVGFWGNVPDVVREPLKWGATIVPWFNADGWVANYQTEFDQLKLMFTTSEWVRQIYKRDGVDISKIMPMHIGIDTDLFKPNPNKEENLVLRRMLGVRDEEKMILTMGGDVTSKGAQEMMKALAEINKEFKDWKYVCKSWPSECSEEWREKELALAEELGIADKIVFVDDAFSQEFMAEVLNACDIYAAPSRLEGYGMIQVEAMSCGKPIISINKMGPGETIIHNKTGLLAEPDPVEEDIRTQKWACGHHGFTRRKLIKFEQPKTFAYKAKVSDLKKHLLTLLTEDQLREKMGENARKHVLKNLEYKYIAKKMADITQDRLGL